jgi:hypothetical protein
MDTLLSSLSLLSGFLKLYDLTYLSFQGSLMSTKQEWPRSHDLNGRDLEECKFRATGSTFVLQADLTDLSLVNRRKTTRP